VSARSTTNPTAFHIPGHGTRDQHEIETALAGKPHIERYVYAGCTMAFIVTGSENYDKPAALMAYSRTLSMLRKAIGPLDDPHVLCFTVLCISAVRALL